MKILRREEKIKMALHFTENKPNQSVSVPKTPFSIEDILYQNGNMTKSVLKSTCANTHNNSNFISNNVNISNENMVNSSFGKKVRNDNDVNHSKDEEYRKLVPNER